MSYVDGWGFESLGGHVREKRRGVEEFGRPRRPHKPEIVGSNPTTATRFLAGIAVRTGDGARRR